MRNLKKSLIATILLISFIVMTFVPAVAAGQPSSYSKKSNSGERDVICTTLKGTSASSYYTGSYTYERMSSLSSSSLLSTLRGLLKSTHTRTTSYSDCKNYAEETDCENNGTKLVTLYTSYTTSYTGSINREHVWPKSLGGYKESGPGADLHHIRPTESTPNSNRGSSKYGEMSGGKTSTGNASGLPAGTYGTYFEPLDNAKGDVARICLYMYVRYGGESQYTCSSITKVFQSVDVLLEWCELDPVDTWEMGRNEVIQNIQGNRNVFIDYPEYAWLLFGREVPDDMVTPSGNAMDGSSGGSTGGDSTGGDSTGGSTSCSHAATVTRNVKTATCGVAGYTGDTYCSDCGAKVASGKTTPATGKHSWSEPIIITPPTETAAGQSKSTCSSCGAVKTASIPAIGSTPDPNPTPDPTPDQSPEITETYWKSEEEMILVIISKQTLECLFVDYLTKD